jgi:dipeptidyl aminopeptidase/acylaminoacyl peptidase
VYSNAADSGLYLVGSSGSPTALYHDKNLRFADGCSDLTRQRLIAVVEEQGQDAAGSSQQLAAVALHPGGKVQPLVVGADFYSSPRVSPDGEQLVWTQWNLPHMPWERTELFIGSFNPDGSVGASQRIAGGPNESVINPSWSPSGELYFVSDRSGFWNLYRWFEGQVVPVAPIAADCGAPPWSFGKQWYGFLEDGTVAVAICREGISELGVVNPLTQEYRALHSSYTEIGFLVADGYDVWCVAAAPTESSTIVQFDLKQQSILPLRYEQDLPLDSAVISVGTPRWTTHKNGERVQSFLYLPKQLRSDVKPPLLVIAHGGPTALASNGYNPNIQFWTSRGVAVVDVNFRGSTGFGRSYWEALRDQWGVSDLQDIVAVVEDLKRTGTIDPSRVVIRGGSSGGFLALRALAASTTFAAGIVLYPVTDALALAEHGGRFESGYFDWLIGPRPASLPQYRDRSPCHEFDKLKSPILLLHGTDDKVVPISQSEALSAHLTTAKIPHHFEIFSGEGHGFRSAAALQRTLELQVKFFENWCGIPEKQEHS